MPCAASIVAGSTLLIPAIVLFRIGSSEYIHSANIAVLLPMPKMPTNSAITARLGTVWQMFTRPTIKGVSFRNAGRVRMMPKGTDVAMAISEETMMR